MKTTIVHMFNKLCVYDASFFSSKITDSNNGFTSYIPKTITNCYFSSFPLVCVLKVIEALVENIK